MTLKYKGREIKLGKISEPTCTVHNAKFADTDEDLTEDELYAINNVYAGEIFIQWCLRLPSKEEGKNEKA